MWRLKEQVFLSLFMFFGIMHVTSSLVLNVFDGKEGSTTKVFGVTQLLCHAPTPLAGCRFHVKDRNGNTFPTINFDTSGDLESVVSAVPDIDDENNFVVSFGTGDHGSGSGSGSGPEPEPEPDPGAEVDLDVTFDAKYVGRGLQHGDCGMEISNIDFTVWSHVTLYLTCEVHWIDGYSWVEGEESLKSVTAVKNDNTVITYLFIAVCIIFIIQTGVLIFSKIFRLWWFKENITPNDAQEGVALRGIGKE